MTDSERSSRRLALTRVDSECAASLDTTSLAKTSGVDEEDHRRTTGPSTANRFVLSNELGRGLVTGLEEVLHYLLMLIVMYAQLAPFVCVRGLITYLKDVQRELHHFDYSRRRRGRGCFREASSWISLGLLLDMFFAGSLYVCNGMSPHVSGSSSPGR